MLSVACLLNNTQLAEDLKNFIEFAAYSRAANFGKASLASVFHDVRKAGLEVDLRTVGYIYAEVLPLHEDAFDSLDEVEELVTDDFRKLSHALINSTPRVTDEKLGRKSSEEWAAAALARAFYNAHSDNIKTKSDMVIMQQAMAKGARRLLGELPKPIKTKEDFQALIAKAFALNQMGTTDLNGVFKGIQDVFSATQQELRRYHDEIDNDQNLSLAEKALKKAQFNEYMKGLQQSTYTLLLSAKEARKILMDTMKEAGFGKRVASTGNIIMDWVKLAGHINSPAAIRNNVEKALADKGYSPQIINGIKAALEQEFIDLHTEILERAANNISSRWVRSTKLRKPNKTDLMKLAELNNLGIFNSQHKIVLNRLLGVDQLTAGDMADMEVIAKNVSSLQKELGGSNVFGSYAFQVMQQSVNNIVARNINNRTATLKAVGIIDRFMQLKNFGIIANVYNMAENNLSGWKEMLSTQIRVVKQMGWNSAFKDGKLLTDVWLNVSAGGLRYGDEAVKFSNRASAEEEMRVKPAGQGKTANVVRILGKGLTTIGRAFLTGSDSAYKAVIHRKIFMMMIHQALMSKNGMTKEEATDFLHQALYGKSLEDAKVQAEAILRKYNLEVNPRTIHRLASDLVVANLNTGQELNLDIIEAAHKSSFKVAGVGLGHEAQTKVGKGLQAIRQGFAREDAQLIREGDWGALARNRAYDVGLFSWAMPFMGGVYNWMWLRLQSGYGLGIATGLFGDWKKDIDFGDRKAIEESMFKIQDSGQQISRGITGLSFAMLVYAITSAIAYGTDDDKDKESALTQLYGQIKSNFVLNKLFKKTAPDIMLLHYQLATTNNVPLAGWNYVTNFFNLGSSYSMGGQAMEAGKYFATHQEDKAYGQLGAMLGTRTEIPFWRSYAGYKQFGEWVGKGAFTDKAKEITSEWKKPDTFFNGVFMGGAFEDMGLLERDHPLTSIPGVGAKGKERLLQLGIKDINDFENAHWKSIRTEKGVKMFDKKDRVKVQEYLDKQKSK